jgi:hypothetical protein
MRTVHHISPACNFLNHLPSPQRIINEPYLTLKSYFMVLKCKLWCTRWGKTNAPLVFRCLWDGHPKTDAEEMESKWQVQYGKEIALPMLKRPIGQQPISCFCSVRNLDVQVHSLDRMLVQCGATTRCWFLYPVWHGRFVSDSIFHVVWVVALWTRTKKKIQVRGSAL